MLPEAIKVLERCKEINISKGTKELLSLALPATVRADGRAGVKISPASIDHCLRPIRIKSSHGLITTKPGSLRDALSEGQYQCAEKIVHRSPACKRAFKRAAAILEQPNLLIVSVFESVGVKVNNIGSPFAVRLRCDVWRTPATMTRRPSLPAASAVGMKPLFGFCKLLDDF